MVAIRATWDGNEAEGASVFQSLFDYGFLVRASHHVLTFDTAVVMMTWLSALIGALLTFAIRQQDHPKNLRGFLGFCFPSIILRHRSCRLDLGYTIAAKLVHPLLLAPLLVGNVVVAQVLYGWLTDSFGPQPQLPMTTGLWIASLVATVVISDLANFVAHFGHHHFPALWAFHKVHHSTEFLLPISNRRIHPVQELIDTGSIALGVGVWLAAMAYMFHQPIEDISILGVDAYFVANLLSFYHLRHSHIPMSYGWLENIVMSPAQHQLHHSCEIRHWDRNFGLLLSCWDKMAGTFLRSETEPFRLGLPQPERSHYTSVARLYLVPPLELARMAGQKMIRRPPEDDPLGQAELP